MVSNLVEKLRADLLSDLVYKMVDEHHHCALVGFPGIGKSSLIEEFLKELEVSEWCVVQLEMGASSEDLVKGLRRNLKDKKIKIPKRRPESDSAIDDLEDVVTAYAKGRNAIMVLQSFEHVRKWQKSELAKLTEQLYGHFNNKPILMLLESSLSIRDVVRDAVEIDQSKFTKLFNDDTLYVKPLNMDQLVRLAQEKNGVKFQDGGKWLFRRVGGFPKLIDAYLRRIRRPGDLECEMSELVQLKDDNQIRRMEVSTARDIENTLKSAYVEVACEPLTYYDSLKSVFNQKEPKTERLGTCVFMEFNGNSPEFLFEYFKARLGDGVIGYGATTQSTEVAQYEGGLELLNAYMKVKTNEDKQGCVINGPENVAWWDVMVRHCKHIQPDKDSLEIGRFQIEDKGFKITNKATGHVYSFSKFADTEGVMKPRTKGKQGPWHRAGKGIHLIHFLLLCYWKHLSDPKLDYKVVGYTERNSGTNSGKESRHNGWSGLLKLLEQGKFATNEVHSKGAWYIKDDAEMH